MTQETTPSPSPESPPARTGFSQTFWILNSIEMWERLAYFNVKAMVPIYIMQADNPGGLHLASTDRGVILAWWAVFQSILPIITGGFADRFGYKRTLFGSITTMMLGYTMMGLLRDLPFISNYWAFFISVMVLATGTAFFKPSIQGSLAHQLTKDNSSVGWGIFYWVVNIGAFAAHFLPSIFLEMGVFYAGKNSVEAWRNLYLASAFFTSFNLLLLFTFRDVPSGASKTESIPEVLYRTLTNILEWRLLFWMFLMSCFWLMMYQLWDMAPNFITDWVDSGPLVQRLSWLPEETRKIFVGETPRGPMIHQQVLISFNSFCVILGVVPLAWLTRKMRTLSAMLIGMVMATFGILLAGWTQNVWLLLGGIFFFSLGEMLTGPKKSEYLALIAPPGKKGLYLGYVNIPVGVGIFVGSLLAGMVYGRFGEKAVLALRYLAEKTAFGSQKNWNGNLSTLESTLGIERTQAMEKMQQVTGLDAQAATDLLWNTYAPQHVWIPFAAIGVVAAIGLFIFGQRAKRWSDMNA